MAVPTFVDRVTLRVTGGRGGDGVASVHREKFKPLGGPDGGNGGHGGDVVLRVDDGLTTLVDYHHESHRRGGHGGQGAGSHRNGSNGAELVLPVPDGTVVRSADGEVIADLVGAGTSLVVAAGGRGGLGNAALASTKRKAPGFALLGEPGDDRAIVLELKVVADVGLVGFPSAGKSSLVAALSRARPKIADYPFTTLVPNLGVVTAGGERFTVADVPGLIPGASEGKGLGMHFLRHVERCHVLAHVIDCATLEPGRDPLTDLDVIEAELAAYVPDASLGGLPLADRVRMVVLNKADVPEARELAEMVAPDVRERGLEVHIVSAVAHQGLKDLTFALAAQVAQARSEAPVVTKRRTVIRPTAVDDTGFVIERDLSGAEEMFRVVGERPTRWVRQTDFTNDEAVGYLADRLNRLGVEEELLKAGAVAGSTVLIGPVDDAVVFDWEPTMSSGAELLGQRGSDVRLEDDNRPTRDEKRAAFHGKVDAAAAARAELAAERGVVGADHDEAGDP